MPYIKPGELLKIQKSMKSMFEGHGVEKEDLPKDALSLMDMCSVCGEEGCEKTVVYVNDVFIHKEDAIEADEVSVDF